MSEPEITVTIKFRGVSLEGLTPKELRELRDAIDQVLGERVIERYEYAPYRQQPGITWGASGTKIDVQPAETVITCDDTFNKDNRLRVWAIDNGGFGNFSITSRIAQSIESAQKW